jgi:iron complex outermembrane receptor protein
MGLEQRAGAGASARAVMTILSVLALVSASPASAEEAVWSREDLSLQTAQTPAANALVHFDIPAKPLADALMAFGAQSGLQVTMNSAIAAGKQSTPVVGEMTAEAALKLLLSGSGISWRFLDNNTVALELADTGQSSALAPLTVEGRSETATSPVDGYVATQSATGSKTDTPIIETPQSISVISAERLQAQGAETLGDALRYTPGVQSELLGNDFRGYGIFIRGFNANASSYYRDGLQLKGTTYSAFMPLDIYGAERLEVLRGPASVLYGQNSPGGIMNYVSKRPTEDPLHEVIVGFGNFDHYEGKFDLGGPVTEDGSVLYRVTGAGHVSDSQVDFVEDQRGFIAPAVTWKPSDDTSLTVLAHYQHDDAGWGVQFYPARGTIYNNPNGDIPRHTFTGEPDFDEYILDQYSVGYMFEHDFDDTFTFRQNARYAGLDSKAKEVYGVGSLDDRTLERFGDRTKSNLDTVSVDNQLEAKFDIGPVANTGLFGVDFQYYSFSDLGVMYDVAPLDLYDPHYGADVSNPFVYDDSTVHARQVGIYLQEQAKLFDKLVLLVGGRYDFARSEKEDHIADTTTTVSDEAFTGRAGLVYLFDNGLAPYFSYSESFEPILSTNPGGEPFKPEEGRQYEVGIKFQPANSESFITISAFDLVKRNVLTQDLSDPTGLSQVQTGEIRSRGIEVEGVASFDFGLDLTAAYTFLDAEITKSNVDGEVGNRPGRVGKHSASLWADYTIPEGDFEGFGLGAGVRYVGPTAGDNKGDITVPGYALMDAAIHYDWNDFRFALNGTNLLDKAYVTSCFGQNSCYYGERRTVLGTISYKW